MDTANTPRIHTLFVTALQAEATPLIEHYRLKAYRTRAFRFYQSASATAVSLIVCGIGETSAASATSFALGFLPENCIAINIGIAGSDNPVGSLFQASCICRDASRDNPAANGPSIGTQRNFYPHLPCKGELPRLTVMTLDKPRTDYVKNCCFEMEAYGFCFAARQFLAAEHVHCLKVISDNPTAPLGFSQDRGEKARLDTATISNLVHARLESIYEFSNRLAKTCETHVAKESRDSTDSALVDYISRIETDNNIQLHFTTSQYQRLLRIAERYSALDRTLPQTLTRATTDKFRTQPNPANSKEVLKLLETGIAGLLPNYGNKNPVTNPATTDVSRSKTE